MSKQRQKKINKSASGRTVLFSKTIDRNRIFFCIDFFNWIYFSFLDTFLFFEIFSRLSNNTLGTIYKNQNDISLLFLSYETKQFY